MDYQVCRKCYQAAAGIGEAKFKNLLLKLEAPDAEMPAEPRKERSDKGSGAASSWFPKLKDYIHLIGETMPHMSFTFPDGRTASVVFLPNGIYNSKIEVIAELRRLNIIPTEVSDYTIYHLWHDELGYAQIRDWAPFCKCDICCKFKTGHVLIVSEAKDDMSIMTSEKYLEMRIHRDAHLADINMYRSRLSVRQQLACAFSDSFLFMYIDGMDNQKTSLPHLGAMLKAKDIDAAGIPLQTKLLGVLVPGRGFFSFITLPTLYHGANLTWTALLHVLDLLKNGRTLPPVLLLQLDNCGRDNKNQLCFAILGLFVHLGMFEEIQMNFMPVGHTHNEIDQHFSVISQKIRAVDILTPEALLSEIGGLFQTEKLRKDAILEQVHFKSLIVLCTWHWHKSRPRDITVNITKTFSISGR